MSITLKRLMTKVNGTQLYEINTKHNIEQARDIKYKCEVLLWVHIQPNLV